MKVLSLKTKSGFGTAEAVQLTEDNVDEVAAWVGGVKHTEPIPPDGEIRTYIYVSRDQLPGTVLSVGYYAVKAVEAPGGIYVLSGAAFTALYEGA